MLTRSLALSALAITLAAPAFANEVNVYSYREQKLIQPLFEAFTKDTGIKVNVISASSGLEQRIKTEGANSPADVLLTVDVARIQDAIDAGVTQPIKSAVLDKTVASQYRDPDGAWYGISMRATSTVSSTSAGELAPSVLMRCSSPELAEITLTLMPVSLVKASNRGWISFCSRYE